MVAYIDHHSPVYLNSETYPSTVRSVKCDMLIHGGKCKACSLYYVYCMVGGANAMGTS